MRLVRVGPGWMPRAVQCGYCCGSRSTPLLGTRFTASRFNSAALALHRALARNIEGAI